MVELLTKDGWVIKDNYAIIQDDCMEAMHDIPDNSVDMVLCDLPYAMTKNAWDTALPMNDYVELKGVKLDKEAYTTHLKLNGYSNILIKSKWEKEKRDGLWTYYDRVLKDNGVVLLFAQDMFSSDLMQSNKKMYKYKYFWQKDRPSGFLNAKKMPLKDVEEILVFYKKAPIYNPQMWEGKEKNHSIGKGAVEGYKTNNNYGDFKLVQPHDSNMKYPRQVLKFNRPHPPIHPTQKPVDLCRWLIRTYTNRGGVIMDNTMGVGSIGVGVLEEGEGRYFIGIELLESNYMKAEERLENIKIK